MTYRGLVLGSSEFKSSATLVKVRILKFVSFYFKYLSLSVWEGVGVRVVKTLNDKSLPG